MVKWWLLPAVCACCSAPVFGADIMLRSGEAAAIRLELEAMSEATNRLRGELRGQRELSRKLLETSEGLQARLESALGMLEESGKRLELSERELNALLTELAALRAAYAGLAQSYERQKSGRRRWQRIAAAGWISAAVIAAGGILWGTAR